MLYKKKENNDNIGKVFQQANIPTLFEKQKAKPKKYINKYFAGKAYKISLFLPQNIEQTTFFSGHLG